MISTILMDAAVTLPDGSRRSILTMPLGTGAVLEQIVRRARSAGSNKIHILPCGEDELPAGFTAGLDVSRLDPSDWTNFLWSLEPADWLLLIDVRYWPTEDLHVEGMIGDHFHGASHGLSVGSEEHAMAERVHCDDSGRIHRISRLYLPNIVVEPQKCVITHSIIPVCAALQTPLVSLSEMRLNLTAHGILTRDLPMTHDVVRLDSLSGLLSLNESRVMAEVCGELPPDYSRLAPGILIGRGALIDASVTIVPPVIIQPGTLIEEDVRIVGPAVIGSRSTIGRGVIVAQSVVSGGASIESGRQVRHCLAFPDGVVSQPIYTTLGSDEQGEQRLYAEFNQPAFAGNRLDDRVRDRRFYLAAKRMMDFFAALAGLCLFSPLLLVVAALIKLTSRGPVFFGHMREFAPGKSFHCLKFRTMRPDAHQMQRELYKNNNLDGPQFKMDDDPRVTPIGKILRRTNVDELPQLFNVLLGHMSLVGPRPSPFRENQICVPWRLARLSVKPGITGLWQVCRTSRASGDFQQWIFYDILYVRNMSLWLDIKILAATILTLGGKFSAPLHWILGRDRRHQILSRLPVSSASLAG